MSLHDGGTGFDLTIANGGTASNVIKAKGVYSGAARLLFMAAAVLAADAAYTIEVTDDPDATSVVWRTLHDDTDTAIAPPAAGFAKAINDCIGSGAIRIKSAGAVTGAKTWRVHMQMAYGS